MTSRRTTKKKIILDAALKVFADKGYHYATIGDIAREAGIAKGSVHVYFESKLDVLLSIILLFWQSINEANRNKLNDDKNPLETLKELFSTFQDMLLHDVQSLYWAKILREGLPKLHDIKSEQLRNKQADIERERKKLMETIDAVIRKGQRQGLIKKNIKHQALRQILGGSSQLLVYGLFMHLNESKGIGYREKDVRDSMSILIDSFSA